MVLWRKTSKFVKTSRLICDDQWAGLEMDKQIYGEKLVFADK